MTALQLLRSQVQSALAHDHNYPTNVTSQTSWVFRVSLNTKEISVSKLLDNRYRYTAPDGNTGFAKDVSELRRMLDEWCGDSIDSDVRFAIGTNPDSFSAGPYENLRDALDHASNLGEYIVRLHPDKKPKRMYKAGADGGWVKFEKPEKT